MVTRLLVGALGAGCAGRPAPADVIVALGGGLYDGGAPSRSTAERVRAAVRLWGEGWAPALLMSGGRAVAGVSEAQAMGRAAESAGVPRARITLEQSSLNTFENARYSASFMRARGQKRAILVTSPSHLRRSLAVFRGAGVEVLGFHDADARDDLYQAAREVVALGLFRLLGFI
ncbi:MAG TPA: YdcF family protein [Myxococcota bacterium]|jgi:uncharacterized SAM-binding protein YcdF (DUF218 family)|nr:YdcF family protein [Myxococcota bacterium]